MSAPLTLAAAPAAGASAPKAGPARTEAARTGAAEAFRGTLSAVLAAVPADSAPANSASSTPAPAAEAPAEKQAQADPGAGTVLDARPASPAPPVPAAAAAVQAQGGSVQPGLVFAAGEPRKAEEPAGENGEEVLFAGIPSVIPGTAASGPAPGLTPGAAPGTASLVPKTPAAVPGAAQAAPAGARIEASVNRPLAVDPAGGNAYLAGAPSPTTASAAAPAFAPAPAPAPAAAAPAAASSAPAPPGFAAQLARPVFTLASGAAGEHTMTLAVNPESLGPVTVQAHITAAGVRVELFAASADGREALRQILPDLKRDLAGAGLNASLDLSAGNQPGGEQDAREQFFHGRAATGYSGGTGSPEPAINNQASGTISGHYGTDGSLDVMA